MTDQQDLRTLVVALDGAVEKQRAGAHSYLFAQARDAINLLLREAAAQLPAGVPEEATFEMEEAAERYKDSCGGPLSKNPWTWAGAYRAMLSATLQPPRLSGMGVAMSDWVILIGSGYGAFLFQGTEQEAEEMRVHKSRWERGIGKKRAATDEEVSSKTPSQCWNHPGFANKFAYADCYCDDMDCLSNAQDRMDKERRAKRRKTNPPAAGEVKE